MDLERPEHWETAKLEELAVLTLGGDWGKDADFESAEYSLAYCIRGAEFRNWDVDRGSTASPRMIKNSSLANRTLQDGDILVEISGGGPEQPVGRTVLIDRTVLGRAPHIPKICTNFLRLLRPTQEIASSYLNCYLTFFYRSGEIRNYQAGSNNLRNLKFNDYLSLEIPIPPLAEQHRIVAKIEELFSELDQGVASLKTAREQLKVYRQSLLKNAFEGKLTAAWRAAHADQLETAAALQQRIARERQARYQQQLADWQTAGQAGPKPKPPKPLPPLTAEELAELPELPEGWGWVKYGDLCSLVRNGISAKPEGDSGTPIFRISAVRPMCFDMADIRYINNAGGEFDAYGLERGDLVFTRYNGSRQYVGVCAEYRSDEKRLFPDKLVQTRVSSSLLLTSFLEKALNSGASRAFVESKIRTTAGQSGVSGEDIKNIPVPVCCLEEQHEIVQELESKLSEADQLDQTLATALQQADALRQSILKKAFCGQLVKQDENDEPATALLERIRAGKSGQSKGKSRRIAPDQPEILELTASPGQVIPFPVPLPGIAAKDLQAGIVAMAYRLHEPHPEKLEHFGHVKAEKICHLVEAHLGLDLERQPVKEAAGPNDHPHLKKVEHRARMVNWFDVSRLDSGRYVFHPKSGFDRLLAKTRLALGPRLDEVERLLELMLPMTMRQAEILATVYAAWNNLLLLGKSPNDEEIVTEARENWHESKLKIERDKFFTALAWMRGKGLVPSGRGRFVAAKGKK